MKVLLWSDLHLHDWPQLSSMTDSGVNDRLIDGVEVMNTSTMYVKMKILNIEYLQVTYFTNVVS